MKRVQYAGRLRLNQSSEMTSPTPKPFSTMVDMGTPLYVGSSPASRASHAQGPFCGGGETDPEQYALR